MYVTWVRVWVYEAINNDQTRIQVQSSLFVDPQIEDKDEDEPLWTDTKENL